LHAAGLGEGEWDPLFAVNVKAAWLAVQALQPRLAGGNVVLLGSVGAVKAMESPVVHTASHGALAALARSLGKELGAQNTRVNLLALGPLTEGASRALPAELLSEYSKHSCLRRQATPAEAAETIASFALTNTYVTGQVVVLDGGL
jgi:3-oxoacyl-[acyl-carrier protein] reductase